MSVLTGVRRVLIFAGVAAAGLALVTTIAGGLRPGGPRQSADAAPARPADHDPATLVPVATGTGRGGTSLGPGRGGRLDLDDVAVVGGRLVPWRTYTATWETSTPMPSRDGVMTQRLDGARVVLYPRPSADAAAAVASETAPGVTAVSSKVAWLRRKENDPPSIRLEGDCVVSHRLDASDTLELRSDVLDLRTEERGTRGKSFHVLETDQPVRLDGGGVTVEGRGLTAEIDAGQSRTGRRAIRIPHDVVAILPAQRRRAAAAADPGPLRVSCRGGADVSTLDTASRDGRQPWRATFREDVRAEDALSEMHCGRLEVDFVRSGAADRAAGAGSTEVRTLTADGGVRIDGRGPGETWHVESRTLRRFAEDALTDVTVLEGAPVIRWGGLSLDGTAAGAVYEVRCSGRATLRERREAAGRDAAARITVVFEGDVAASETRDGTVRSELRAPLVTMEGRRSGGQRIDPHLLRAEQGAKARFGDVAAAATTVTVTASQGGSPQRIALVGSPVARLSVPEGAHPLGGTEGPGVVELTAGSRIDLDVGAAPAAGIRPTGTRVSARTLGGFTARKLVGDTASWQVTAKNGDAKIGWDDAIEELHASGDATLAGAGGGTGARRADLTGDRIDVVRRPGTAGREAWKHLEAVVLGTPGRPATASYGDAADGTRRDEIRAARLVRTDSGRALVATGEARATVHRSASGQGALDVAADDIRLDLLPAEDGSATLRLVTLAGRVVLRDAMHTVSGDRATYDPGRGEAEVTAAAPGSARVVRYEDARFPSSAAGPAVRVRFDPKGSGADRFLTASFPSGGEIIAYFVAPAHQRVTTRSRGPLELTRTTASCATDVVTVYERRGEDGRWNSDGRIDADRVDLTFDPAPRDGQMSNRLRTLVATGTAARPARIRSRDATGRREAQAEAERIEGSTWDTKLRLSCRTEGSQVTFHDLADGSRARCDAITFDYVTHGWTNAVRWQAVE